MKPQQLAILKKLKGELEYGDVTELAKRTGYSREYVGMCLNPKNDNYNSIIVEAALALIEERLEKEKAQIEKLENL
jgi:hypothetical protein